MIESNKAVQTQYFNSSF